MITNKKGASSSKKIQRGLVALVALLLVGTLFVGAGAAATTTYTGSAWYTEDKTGESFSGLPDTLVKGDTVVVVVDVKGKTTLTDELTFSATAQADGHPIDADLTNVEAVWTLENCNVTWRYDDKPYDTIVAGDGQKKKEYVSSRMSGDISVDGKVEPAVGATSPVKAHLEVQGIIDDDKIDIADFKLMTVSQLYDEAAGLVTPGSGNEVSKEVLKQYDVTVTVKITRTTSDGGNYNPHPSTPTTTTPATQTATVQADGTATATVGGTTYTIDLGAGATGSVTVTELGKDVQLPAGANVLAGSDITITVPLTNGKTATVSMSLPMNKLPANVADVVMQHFKNGNWEDLPTVYTVTGNTVKYSGETDSFSPFILVEKANGATPAIPTDVVPTQTATPTETPASPAFGVLAVLAGLGAVAALRKD